MRRPKPPYFKDWIETQENPAWGVLDEATILVLKDYFKYRRIATRSSERMAAWFWSDIAMFGPQYAAQLLIEANNDDFDPTVARYLEAEYKQRRNLVISTKDNTRDTVTGQSTGTSTETGTSKLTGEDTFTTHRDDSRHVNGHEGVLADTDMSEIRDPYTDVERKSGKDIEDYDVTDSTTFANRQRETTKNGSRTLRRTGSAANNYVKDAPGSGESTSHLVDTQTTTKRSGSHVIEDDSMVANKSRQAAKTAPMSAVNLGRESDDSKTGYGQVHDGSLGKLDFTYASSYGENDTQQGTTTKRKEYYEGDNTIVEVDGNKVGNVDTTLYTRNQQTATDITENENFAGLRETMKDSGSENRQKTGAQSTIYNSAVSTDHGKQQAKTTGTVDTQTDRSSDDKGTLDGKDTTNYGRTNTDTTTGNVSESSNVTTERDGNKTVQNADENLNRNRLTGREGLTPQQAFESALKYLQRTPLALQWLFSRLEHNFLQVFYFDDLYEEEY